ncbi:thiolase family protein [Oceanibacterium hippocampi]|uniref:propanoyl-CoA C-acyltransferase n=1 Tax=Oceanibacterium hippocampi TaxID=745714 RepID=A0A1Y5S8F8_9PROT|nr:thiolase family protein [Oceanibacterium hippocampi]SLN34841.1 Beta-ketoadipyl-CoA thiolase [Oceanibacterium hippocampi]
MPDATLRDVYVIGAYTSAFGKYPGRSFKDLTREAYLGVLEDSGLEDGSAIEFGWFGNCGMWNADQACIRGQVCFTPLVREGLFPERVPIVNVEGACATASMAFHGAVKDIMSGMVQCSLAIGVEKTFFAGDWERIQAGFQAGIDNLDPEEWQDHYREVGEAIGRPFAPGGDRTIFMDTYAMQAAWHMQTYGTTQAQIAAAAAKSHNNGANNPKAQYRFEMTAEQVLGDRPVSPPLTRSMCAPIGDGAAAAILCSGDFLANLPKEAQARAVKVRASVLTGGKYRALDEPSLSHVAARKAYDFAGLSPADMSLAEVHDATSFCEVYQSEMLGFCDFGDGGKLAADGETALDGRIPINTSGGLVSKGHPVGATGLSMIEEMVRQLRGEAGDRQVKDPTFAIQENGGGVMGVEEAACSVVILERTH